MREHITRLALKLCGCPYIWGGSQPWNGFDCSGFVIWLYQAFAILPSGDWNAQALADHFPPPDNTIKAPPQPGDLAFYGPHWRNVIHTMVYLGQGLTVGASGGDHTTTTRDEAARRGAAVKVKPLTYRHDLLGTLHVPMPGD